MSVAEKKLFHNPFGALGDLRSRLKEQAAPGRAESALEPERAASPPPARIARAVVRLERSGRGGKEVTVIEHLGLTPGERDAWLKALKAALGCGGSVEGEALTLQGDQRTRLPKLLAARGVKKVTMG
jgi:translation initiation factor 1